MSVARENTPSRATQRKRKLRSTTEFSVVSQFHQSVIRKGLGLLDQHPDVTRAERFAVSRLLRRLSFTLDLHRKRRHAELYLPKGHARE